MYLLMGTFHLPPWPKLISTRRNGTRGRSCAGGRYVASVSGTTMRPGGLRRER
jgi:hypothetical protein